VANAIPVTFETEETIRTALQLRAAKEDASPSDVLNTILRKALAAEIEQVRGVPPLTDVIQNVVKATGKGDKSGR
jgi:hypothetical protein